jgi:collagenase-like PrtC family protease
MDLLDELGGLRALGVKCFRLWPQQADMVAVAALFRSALDGAVSPAEAQDRLAGLCPGAEFANGYLHGRPGHTFFETED